MRLPFLSDANRRLDGSDEPITNSRVGLAKLLVVAFVALAVGVGMVAQRELVDDKDEASGLILWGVALGFFLVALWQARSVARDTAEPTTDSEAKAAAIPPLAEAALFLAVLAVGIFFRFYRIGSIPPGLNHDAAWNGLYAVRITPVIDYFSDPYVAAAWGRETMFHHVIAIFQSLLGPSQFAIQLAAITVGIATLVAFYLFIRRLFDTRLALVATFLLGVSGWHLTMSKVGWRTILVPLFASLVFYFLVKAVQERRMHDFVLAGIFLGLSLDTYDAARIIPFIAVAYIIYEIVRKPALLRTHYVHWGFFGAAALLAFSPLGWYALNHWDEYTGRSNFLWIGTQVEQAGSLEPLFTNIKNALLMFNFRANGNDFFVREPLLDLPVSVFFTLGFVYALTRIRQRGHFLLVVMLVFTLVVGIASQPNGNRGFGTVLPVTAFAAIFLYEAWRWLDGAYPRYKHVFSVALVGVLMFVGFLTYDSYWGPSRLSPDRTNLWGFYPETTRVGRYMQEIAGEYEIHAAAGNWPRDALTYLSYQGDGDPFARVYTYATDATELLDMELASGKGTAFIIEATPENTEVLGTLQRRFPGAPVDNIYYPDGSENVIAYALRVPAGSGSSLPIGSDGALGEPQIEAGAAERDDQRRDDLQRISAALLDYRERTGSFPDTNGNVQTACVYLDLDQLCQFQDQLGLETFNDPRGDPGFYGYWYASDGASFALYAAFEGQVTPADTCTPSDEVLARKRNLFCLQVGD